MKFTVPSSILLFGKTSIATLLCAGLLSISVAQGATIISGNFQGTDPDGLASSDVTGVYAAANWNNLTGGSGSSIAMFDSTNSSTGITVSFGMTGLGNINGPFGPDTPQGHLIGGGLGVNYGTASFTLSGLDAYSSYDIIAYYSGGSAFPYDRNLSVSSSESATIFYGAGINSQFTTFTQATSTTSGSPTQGNYVVFSGLTDATQTITAHFVDNSMTFSGFQIVGVPEPSTCVLVGMGGFALLFLRRRTRYRA
ncbi:hypothetical protein BH09VER1_BH09VER1_27980 [soil metagenome]